MRPTRSYKQIAVTRKTTPARYRGGVGVATPSLWVRSLIRASRKLGAASQTTQMVHRQRSWPTVTHNTFVQQLSCRYSTRQHTSHVFNFAVSLAAHGSAQRALAAKRETSQPLSPAFISAEHKPRVPSADIDGKLSVARQLDARNGDAKKLPLIKSTTLEYVRQYARQRRLYHETSTETLVARVRERHRRTEEHRSIYARNLRLQTIDLSPSVPEMTVIADRRPATKTVAYREIEAESHHSSRPAQPVIDSVRLTDEVLRQLDRRLVAARERMGRV